MSASPMRKVIRALERKGCHPVEVAPGRWLALCPCCGHLDLIVTRAGMRNEPPTNAERDAWLEARGRPHELR